MRFDGAATAVRLRFDSLPIAARGQGLRSGRRLARREWSGQGVEMEIRILGSFDVAGSAGVVDLRGVKRRGLLACLVVHAGRPMSTDRLVSEPSGDGGSEGATRTVQTHVSQLRKLLRGERASLDTRPRGYVLAVDPAVVDAYRFEEGVTAALIEPDPARRPPSPDRHPSERWVMSHFIGSIWQGTGRRRPAPVDLVREGFGDAIGCRKRIRVTGTPPGSVAQRGHRTVSSAPGTTTDCTPVTIVNGSLVRTGQGVPSAG
jgi:DNA-binding winged helix-turn-helix (wHTH) protein